MKSSVVTSSLFAIACICSGSASAFDQYAITDLGSIVNDPASANDYSYPYDINDRGDVVGFSKGADGLDHAFVRLRGQNLTDLGEGRATSINNHRHFVGRSNGSNYVMWKLGPLGFGVTDLGVQNAGVYGWGAQQSIEINEMDEVAGASSDPVFFFWKNGILTDLGSGDGNFCNIEGNIGLNNRGDVSFSVGGYYQSTATSQVGFPDSNPASWYTYLYSINDAGEMVGLAKTGYGGSGAYYSAATGFKNLPALATGPRALSDINNAGIAVGGGNYPVYSGNDPTLQPVKAYVYAPAEETYAYLDTLVPEFQTNPPSKWNLKVATAINDAGQIVGVGINPQGKTHAFLLTPIGQP